MANGEIIAQMSLYTSNSEMLKFGVQDIIIMKKQRAAIVIRWCIVVFLVLSFIIVSSPVVIRKDSQKRYTKFYNNNNAVQYDVLFMGTSHMFDAISPMELWHQAGITSYNLAGPGMRIPVAYWIIKNALEYSSPRLVVIDCAYLREEKTNSNLSYVNIAFDAVPLTPIKVNAALDLFDNLDDRIRIIWPYSVYHNRWSELTEDDFHPSESSMYGFVPQFGWEDASSLIINGYKDAPYIDNTSTHYLQRIVELCKENDIEILLTYIPFSTDDVYQNESAWVKSFAETNRLLFLGPVELLSVIDVSTDYYDYSEKSTHLNYWGAMHLTRFIGTFIKQHYDLNDHRGLPEREYWEEEYQKYLQQLMNKGNESGIEGNRIIEVLANE